MGQSDRLPFVVLGCLLMVITAAVLTSVSTPAPHTGGDNAGYLSLAHSLASGQGYTELWDPGLPAHTKYPPMFPLILGTLMIAGASSWMAFKLLMAILMSISVLLVFAWASERVGPLSAAAVAVITLFTAGWLQASRWVLSDPAFLVLTFLSLWAVEHATADAPRMGGRLSSRGWLVLAGVSAILAFFTRSAGLPLVLALSVSLLLSRRVWAASLFAMCLAIPGIWWLLRLRGGGEGAYQSEFWMVNPYEPQLGVVTWTALPSRAWSNLRLYVGEVLPGEWWSGATGGVLVVFGILLMGFAMWGWLERIRLRPATAELFVPLYLGLILIWPEVWSGDRFILPLYPFILLYAGESVARTVRPLGRMGSMTVVSAVFLLFLLPALPRWLSLVEDASVCRRVAQAGDPIRCQGSGFVEFRDAAVWSGANLPEGAVVLNRKPRAHYLFGGPSGRIFPFTRDPDQFLAEADRMGARYLLLDHIDTVALFYLPAVIRAQPLAFCHIIGWGRGDSLGTNLFGILPEQQRRPDGDLSQLQQCPESYRSGPESRPIIDGDRIPRVGVRGGLSQVPSEPLP